MAPELKKSTNHSISELGIGRETRNFLFPSSSGKAKNTIWMTTPIPGATLTFLNLIPKLQAADFNILLSISNSESLLMVQNRAENAVELSAHDKVAIPDILFISGGETPDSSIKTINQFKEAQKTGSIVYQEDAPGSMQALLDFATQADNNLYLPDLLLTPTRWKAREYRKMYKQIGIPVFATGNPALDILPSDQPPASLDIQNLKQALEIKENDIVLYIVGKPAQDMTIPNFISLPEHEELNGELAIRKDVNTFFLAYALQAIEDFRLKFQNKIGNRSLVVLYRPHPRDTEDTQGFHHPISNWFAENYPDSPIRFINQTTEEWNRICRPEDLFYVSNMAIFFDSTLIDRLVVDFAAREKSPDLKQKTDLPDMAYPVIFHPHVSLYVPYFHKRVEEERMWAAPFTRHKRDFVNFILPEVIFDRERTEWVNIENMYQLAFEYRKITSKGKWISKKSADFVVEALKTLSY